MAIADLTTIASGHAPALVAALLHSLWQAALLAAGCKVALLIVPCRRPNWRYGITLASLATVVVLFLVTLRLQTHQPSPSAVTPAPLAVASFGELVEMETPPVNTPPAAPTASPEWSTTPPSSAPTWQTALGCLWLAGVLLMLLRAARILHGEKRIAGTSHLVNDPAALALLDKLRTHLRIARRVLIATVDTACSPAVVGVVTPVILVPATILTGSTPDHLRAILAHELAHIRRWDVLINVLQLLVECLFFHNPFVWLLSAQIRHEREACCDAVAADCCGGAPAYARVLVDVGQNVLTASAAASFAHPNGLSDRVRRLLGIQPARDTWRLPTRSLCIALLAGMTAIFAIAQGTVKATDAILSVTQRNELIETVVTQQKEAAKAAVGSTRYIGQVETPDGGLLPKGTTLIVYARGPDSSGHAAHQFDRKTGRFDVSAKGTTAMLWLRAPGYTPWFQGPMKPGPGPVTDTGLWVLEPQTHLIVRILSDKSEPVPDAKVSERCDPVPNTSFYAGSATTDAAGECVVPLVTDYSVSMDVMAAGFEPAKFKELNPTKDEPLVLRLTPSLPLVLRVLDKHTGKPVAGARIRMLAKRTPITSATYSPDRTPELGTSAADGVCTISDLHRKGLYWLLIDADGHGTELLERIAPGERRDVRLGPPRIVTGTIPGKLDSLTKHQGKPAVWVTFGLQLGDCMHVNSYWVPVEVEDGANTFRIDTLWPGNFRVSGGGHSARFSTKAGGVDVLLEPIRKPATREVRLTLVPEPGKPLPRGTMRVTHQGDLSNTHSAERDLPVVNGTVTFRAPVGSPMSYKPGGVVGGWFAPGPSQSIPAGDTPLTIRIPSTIPAGAIAVSVFEADGTPADSFLVAVRELSKSPHRKNGSLGVGKSRSSSDDGICALTATPLPLGGTYELVVHRGFTFVTTGPISLTRRRPLHKRRLVLAGDATITGRVVGPGGAPVGKVPIDLGLRLAGSSFGTSDIETDEEGRFEFPGVVHHPDAEYTVRVRPRRGFEPRRMGVTDLDRALRIVTKPGLTLTGRILNAKDGAPVRGTKVRVWRSTGLPRTHFLGFYAEELTDSEGRFRFSNLLPGKYELYCDKAVYNAKNPEVTAGQAEPVIWRVPVGR